MSTPNVDLLRRTLAHIEQHPETWDQESFRCGTAMCFAGRAVTLHGASFLTLPDGSVDEFHVIAPTLDPTRRIRPTDVYAAEILGIEMPPPHDCNEGERCPVDCTLPELFRRDKSMDDLRRIVGDICAEAGR